MLISSLSLSLQYWFEPSFTYHDFVAIQSKNKLISITTTRQVKNKNGTIVLKILVGKYFQ